MSKHAMADPEDIGMQYVRDPSVKFQSQLLQMRAEENKNDVKAKLNNAFSTFSLNCGKENLYDHLYDNSGLEQFNKTFSYIKKERKNQMTDELI